MRTAPLLLLVVLAATACTQDANPANPTSATPDPLGSATTAVAVDEDSGCAGGEVFRSSGPVAALGEDEGDARTVSAVRVRGIQGCERLTIDFLSSTGAPASILGPMGVTLIAESADLRITLPPEVTASAVADAAIDSTLIDHLFVVEDEEAGFVIDVHLNPSVPIEASAIDMTSPAQVIIELRRSGGDSAVVSAPRRSDDLVLLSPGSGPGLYPIQVTGYARPGTDSIRFRLADEGATRYAEVMPVDGGAYVWQGFRLVINDGPSGPVQLVVEAFDSDGQTVDGVTVPLDLP
jgi:hypothetical protein